MDTLLEKQTSFSMNKPTGLTIQKISAATEQLSDELKKNLRMLVLFEKFILLGMVSLSFFCGCVAFIVIPITIVSIPSTFQKCSHFDISVAYYAVMLVTAEIIAIITGVGSFCAAVHFGQKGPYHHEADKSRHHTTKSINKPLETVVVQLL